MANNFYNRVAEFNPDELADGDAIEAEFDAVSRGFDTINETVNANKAGSPNQTFNVAPAVEATHAVQNEQLDLLLALKADTSTVDAALALKADTSTVNSRIGSSGAITFRNKIVDGRFNFWYEATSQQSSGYGSDTMSLNSHSGSTKTHSRQALVAGVDLPTIDIPTAKYFSRTVVSSVVGASNFVVKRFRIEDVSILAGKTATFSLYGKADASKNISVSAMQNFGTGGSPSTAINGISAQLVQLTTSFQRKQIQIAFPSISGKTIGTNSDSYIEITVVFDAGATAISSNGYADGMVQQAGTFDVACVQLEEGSVMTPFEELPYGVSQQRVNRYYERSYNDSDATGTNTAVGSVQIQAPVPGTAGLLAPAFFKVSKRTTPAVVVFSSEGTPNTTSTSAGQLAVNLQNVGCSGFTAGCNNGSSVYYLRFQYIADARL